MSARLFARRRTVGRSSPGQGLVELGFLLVMLVMLAVGVFEFGMLLYAHVQVANAAREGAWAASLYRATRYARVTKNAGGTPASCDGVAGWSLQRTAEQAIVYRALDGSGCPQDGGAIVYTSLGELDPAPSPSWTVTVSATLNAEGMPEPTAPGLVVLRYPYRLQIVSNFFPYLTDPLTITKAVAFEYQP
ncbi:MAG TPA: TadE/TadG family type IV pilus assembly protein [Roseiflexaceae bacterium]|nr:TadE/TadG family type IV pilus assembly protein [Roseiflexaceae bacterium]